MKSIKATDMPPEEGHIGIVAGPPGTGKSWFCGTMAEYFDPGEVLLISTQPREIESYKYQQYDLDTLIFYDAEWLPDEQLFKAGGYNELLHYLRNELREDTKYKGIIIDNGTEMGELAWHAAMEAYGVGSPSKIKGSSRWDPYVDMSENMAQLLTALTVLTGKTEVEVAQPKIIWMPWHLQPPKESVDDSETGDQKGEGIEYEGAMLPMIKGGFRRKIHGMVGAYIYADVQELPVKPGSMRTAPAYVVQVFGDRQRHCKIPGPKPPEKYIPNTFAKYMELLGT